MVAIVVEALTHRRSVMTSLWAVPKMKRITMPTEVIEDEFIEETTTVEVLGIGKTVNQEMKTETPNLERTESSLDHEFKEFMAIEIEEIPKQEEELEYACLEKESLLPVVIFALLKEDEKKRLVFILKKHKETFAWKTFDIPGISPSFCKHKINFEDDAKPVIQ
nr:reverse transcriptase domain-containing protein [Tanacetum cinerariifolium]